MLCIRIGGVTERSGEWVIIGVMGLTDTINERVYFKRAVERSGQ